MNEFAALHKKLTLDKFPKKLILNEPGGMAELEGIQFDRQAEGLYDLVLAFVFSLDEMERTIRDIAAQGMVEEGGCLYLAYPKKGNRVYKEFIHRDDIFPKLGVDEEDGFVDGTTLKFSKMAALNETFTLVGLRCFHDKSRVKKSADQRVDDYIEKIPELRSALESCPEIMAFYDALSPGYQKDWARYVYSAKTSATREKRLREMAEILQTGCKTKNLYRRLKTSGLSGSR